MAIQSHINNRGAKRKWLFQKEAEGPISDFSTLAQSQSLSDGAFFGSAKNVTSECPISMSAPVVSPASHADARPRPPMRTCARQGTAFTKAAEASAFAQNQSPQGTPSPYTQAPSSSIGSGFLQKPGALAPESMPFSKNTAARSGSEAAPAALGKERVVSPNTDSSTEDDAWNRARWSEFHALKKRQWSLIQRFKETDPTNEHLATLQNNVSFKCRCGAKFQTKPTIGYVEGKPNWLNLHKCGSIWGCPICSQVLMKKHEHDIATGLVVANNLGWDVLFYTNTIPHKNTDDMLELMKKMTNAKTLFKKGGKVSRFLKSKGYEGSIFRLEVTFGINGIHPHNHTIMFFDHKLTTEEYKEISNFLKTRWKESCQSANLVSSKNEKNFDKYGFSMEHTNDVGKLVTYMTKSEKPQQNKDQSSSGLAKEMTNASDAKKAKNTCDSDKAPWGRSQWDVMRGFIDGDPFDTNLWLTFLKAFYRKSAIRWSEGLKEKISVEVDDREDEEKVKMDEEKKENTVPIYEVGKYNNVLRHGLWHDIIKSVENKDFSQLEHITNKYNIDFNSVHEDFPSFHCHETKRDNALHERYLENMKKLKEEEAKAEKIIAARKREKAQRASAKCAILAKQEQYSSSLLSEEDSNTLANTIQNNRRAALQKKHDERLRRKNEAIHSDGRRVA